MTTRASAPSGTCTAVRVGLFGILGAGNIGNDAQMESVLAHLRTHHPEIVLDAFCTGPDRLQNVYGIEATPQRWQQRYEQAWDDRPRSRIMMIALNGLGLGIDAFRTASWVRLHDVVIVPGAGVLEVSLPVRPWGTPYAMFLLCASGRIFRRKVILLSVGATAINQRTTRWLSNGAARLATYRSYRDLLSHEAMRRRGIDTTRDRVYPDLAFGTPTLPINLGDPQVVGVGVLAYFGTNDDWSRAAEKHASYVEKMKTFVRWLVDNGRKVRLFVGDTNGSDEGVIQEILADLRLHRPDLDRTWAVAEPVSSFADLMRAMTPVSMVVATRYHNVICALKLCKPTISISYSAKSTALMAEIGLSEFCQDASALDVDVLIKQFTELERRSEEVRSAMAECCEAKAEQLTGQFSELSCLLSRPPSHRRGR